MSLKNPPPAKGADFDLTVEAGLWAGLGISVKVVE